MLRTLIQSQIGITLRSQLPFDAQALIGKAQEWVHKPLERAQSSFNKKGPSMS